MRIDGVTGAAPAVLGKALITAGSGEQQFITVKGVDVAMEPTVTAIGTSMMSGRLEALVRDPDQAPGIVLGADLADALRESVGDSVTMVSHEGVASPIGRQRSQRRFVVVGTFKFGFYEFDDGYGLTRRSMKRARSSTAIRRSFRSA